MVKYLGYRLAQGLSLSLPAPAAFALAERLADGYRCRCVEDRAAVEANLRALADGQDMECSPVVQDVFRNFGRYLVEFFTIHRLQRPQVHIEGAEHLAQARGRGAIILTAHLGNWEVGAVTIHRMGIPMAVVALPHEDPRMDGLFNRQRQRCGLEVIPLGDHAAQRTLQTLRQGHAVGILGDRTFAGDRGVRVAWGGWQRVLPRGPAVLSLRAGVPVIPAFLVREGRWRFRLYVEPPIWPDAQEREEAVQRLTQQYAVVIERYVKRFPAQWLMFQPLAQGVG